MGSMNEDFMENVKKQVCSFMTHHGGDDVNFHLDADISRLRFDLQALTSLMGAMALALVHVPVDGPAALDPEDPTTDPLPPEHLVSYA